MAPGNMISVGGFVATPHAAAHAASEFGLRDFSQALRGARSKRPRIHVCDVGAAFVDSRGIARFAMPTIGPALMSGFPDRWSEHAPDTVYERRRRAALGAAAVPWRRRG